ncbi:MAG: hypothetical protein HY898_23610 [Deltaproteobacteria bacterium]|nr:hypothetical protein [Deltaproteobacteria bacterium]
MRIVREIAALALVLLTGDGGGPVAHYARTVTRSDIGIVVAPPLAEPVPTAAEPQDQPPLPAAEQPAGLDRAIERHLGVALLHIPKGFRTDRCDLVIHFHGAASTYEPQFDAAQTGAALLLINAGIQSGPYETRFADAHGLDRALIVAQKGLDDALGASQCKIGRVALSAWSAGYGAVLKILAHKSNVERIDAVLLADGMHAGYRPKSTSEVDPIGMAPFTRFASEAAFGNKLMSVTHSTVVTQPHASTKETAAFLIQATSMTRRTVESTGPRNMVMTYRADLRGMHVKGFEGGDAAAHSDHLYNFGELLLGDLRDRWQTI